MQKNTRPKSAIKSPHSSTKQTRRHRPNYATQPKRTMTAARSRPQAKKRNNSLADLDALPMSQAPFTFGSPDSPYNQPLPPDDEPAEPYKPPQHIMEDEIAEAMKHSSAAQPTPPQPLHQSTTSPPHDPAPPQTELSIDEILASIKPAYNSHHHHHHDDSTGRGNNKFYVEPPSIETISKAITNTDDAGTKARNSVVQYFRQASRQSDLSKPSTPVPYLLPIGESSPTTYPIPEYLMHTLYHLSGTTVANYGLGMAAPQYGVNYRMFVLRSEVFGVTSAITNIPYILETNDTTHCMVPPRAMQKKYPRPLQFEKMALAWDNPNPEYDFNSKPPLNTSKSMVDYHDMAPVDDSYLATKPGILQYHLRKELTMPLKDAKQLNLCDDRILTQNYSTTAASTDTSDNNHRVYTTNSFINDYRGYSVPLADIERDIFTPLLQSFKQQLPATAIINPRVTAIRYEYFAMREGCFSFPHWHALMSRPIACDVEFETLEVDQARVPQVISRGTQNSIFLSASLAQPAGSQLQYCPKASDDASGLDPQFISPNITRQLEISRLLPKPEQVKLATRKVTLRDVASKVFLHEYDHLDGLQFFDRTTGQHLNWQGSVRQTKMAPHARFEYPVDIAGAYF